MQEEITTVKTVVPKIEQANQKWYVVDANDQVLGRVASKVAVLLRGKHKPQFTPHLDLGDHVIIVNADKVKVTGRKIQQKRYTQYSGYPGGLHVRDYSRVMQLYPERVLKSAVKGMLPKNRLGRRIFKKLKVYTGPDHPHQAQKPEVFSLN
ncbi:50S ribosomal protein L13 [bacterium]|nr:50S ribosomal protein L13 [bacterium]